MFIGHYALGFAAKRVAPRTSLGNLFIAPTLADLLWPFFLLLGWEHVHMIGGSNPFLVLWFDDYPLSHSLFALMVWGAVFAYLYKARTGDTRAGIVIALLVVSHWILDFVTHRPDMPIYPGGPKVGLGLWNSVAGTVIVESALLIAGVAIYLRATRERDAIGRWGFWALVLLLALSYYGSLFAPTPPSTNALAIGGIIFGWLFVLFAWWVDRHREPVALPNPAAPSNPPTLQ